MATINSLYGLGLSTQYTNPKRLLVGLECEIESISSEDDVPAVFKSVSDGSLRNNGREYVSVPMDCKVAVEAFKQLHKSLVFHDSGQKFSNRTSIHVHANCSNLEELQVRNIIMLYALFEEAFFLLVEPSRRDNIHCVPLTETYLPTQYASSLHQLLTCWHKYTALNIKPLSEYGTIEFRHLQGTDDFVVLEQWLSAIENIVEVGSSLEKFDVALLEEDSLKELFTRIFGSTAISNHWQGVYSLMANAIIDVKLGL